MENQEIKLCLRIPLLTHPSRIITSLSRLSEFRLCNPVQNLAFLNPISWPLLNLIVMWLRKRIFGGNCSSLTKELFGKIVDRTSKFCSSSLLAGEAKAICYMLFN